MSKPIGLTPITVEPDWWEVSSPKSPGKPNSPASGVQYLFKDDAIDYDLMKNKEMALDEDLKAFGKYIDSPKRKERGKKIAETLTAFGQVFSQKGFASAEFHRHTYKRLEGSPWAAYRFLKRIQEMDCQHHPQPQVVFPGIVNIPHIVDGDDKGGIHFCRPQDPFKDALKDSIVNDDTGVFTGRFMIGKKEKFSTFFPHVIGNEQQMLEVVQKAKWLHKHDNRVLCITTNLQRNFYVEMYVRHRGACIHSAFPLFFCGTFDGQALEITPQVTLGVDELLATAAMASAQDIKYKTDNFLIIDVAPFFKATTHVDRGIYVSFPLALFP